MFLHVCLFHPFFFLYRCNYDYVEVRDGGTINSVLIGRYCGYTAPSTVFSTGNVMFVRFRTDASVPRVGIKGQYKLGRLMVPNTQQWILHKKDILGNIFLILPYKLSI